MEKVSIIEVHPSRWEKIKKLRLEAVQTDPIAFGSSYEEEVNYEDSIWIDRATKAHKHDGSMTVFAESGGQLVGMMGAFWTNRIKTGHIASIYGVYVTPHMRGKGVASKLMTQLLSNIQQVPQIEKIVLSVNTQQESAKALYQKFGFEPIGVFKKDLKIDGVYYDELYMEKLL